RHALLAAWRGVLTRPATRTTLAKATTQGGYLDGRGDCMISAEAFCSHLDHLGIRLVTGVPCSYFGGPLQLLERQPGRYVAAVNEGSALAIAAGAELAGRRSAVILQSSGFGNLVNPLTSLVLTFDIPVLVFMSLRGWPDPSRDEPGRRQRAYPRGYRSGGRRDGAEPGRHQALHRRQRPGLAQDRRHDDLRAQRAVRREDRRDDVVPTGRRLRGR